MTLTHPQIAPAGNDPRPAMPTIVAHLLHARHVPSTEREAFAAAAKAAMEADRARDGSIAISGEAVSAGAFADLAAAETGAGTPGRSGVFLFRTCHRVELYLAPRAGHVPALPALPAGSIRLTDVEAVRHLIEVACGLDSAVFGEDQVLHQLRVALQERRDSGPLDPVLDRLLQTALRGGRRAHTWFDGAPRSLADVALDRIASVVGPLEGRAILVAGAGRMGRLAAFAAGRRGARVLVVNRTDERAAALAAEVSGRAIPYGVDDRLSGFDGVVAALGGPWAVGDCDAARLVTARIPIVDLSSPPCTPRSLAEALGDCFASVDDLVAGPEYAPQDRLRRRVEQLVSETGRDFCQWLRTRESVPLVQAVAAAAEKARRDEIEWLVRHLPNLPDEERATVEQMTHRLVAALLHAPLDALHADRAGSLDRAARDLFGV